MPSAPVSHSSASPSCPASAALSSSSGSVWTLLNRAFTAHSLWNDKDDFLDVIYWARQILGVLLGLIFGLAGVTGALGLIGFAVINAGALYLYWTVFQGVDEEVTMKRRSRAHPHIDLVKADKSRLSPRVLILWPGPIKAFFRPGQKPMPQIECSPPGSINRAYYLRSRTPNEGRFSALPP